MTVDALDRVTRTGNGSPTETISSAAPGPTTRQNHHHGGDAERDTCGTQPGHRHCLPRGAVNIIGRDHEAPGSAAFTAIEVDNTRAGVARFRGDLVVAARVGGAPRIGRALRRRGVQCRHQPGVQLVDRHPADANQVTGKMPEAHISHRPAEADDAPSRPPEGRPDRRATAPLPTTSSIES